MIKPDLNAEQREKARKLEKFIKDPDWNIMEELLQTYIAVHSQINNIDPKKSSDEIAAEVRGRQIAIQSLASFLNETGVIKNAEEKIIKPTSFK